MASFGLIAYSLLSASDTDKKRAIEGEKEIPVLVNVKDKMLWKYLRNAFWIVVNAVFSWLIIYFGACSLVLRLARDYEKISGHSLGMAWLILILFAGSSAKFFSIIGSVLWVNFIRIKLNSIYQDKKLISFNNSLFIITILILAYFTFIHLSNRPNEYKGSSRQASSDLR